MFFHVAIAVLAPLLVPTPLLPTPTPLLLLTLLWLALLLLPAIIVQVCGQVCDRGRR